MPILQIANKYVYADQIPYPWLTPYNEVPNLIYRLFISTSTRFHTVLSLTSSHTLQNSGNGGIPNILPSGSQPSNSMPVPGIPPPCGASLCGSYANGGGIVACGCEGEGW